MFTRIYTLFLKKRVVINNLRLSKEKNGQVAIVSMIIVNKLNN